MCFLLPIFSRLFDENWDPNHRSGDRNDEDLMSYSQRGIVKKPYYTGHNKRDHKKEKNFRDFVHFYLLGTGDNPIKEFPYQMVNVLGYASIT